MDRVKFKDFSAHIDVSFWYSLEKAKLTEWKLSEEPVSLSFTHPGATRAKHQIPNIVTITDTSFDATKRGPNTCLIPCTLQNFNTVEQMQRMDKKRAIADAGAKLVEVIKDKAFDKTSLSQALLYTFANLKTHEFYYLCAFPCLDVESPVNAPKPSKATEVLTGEQSAAVRAHAEAHADDALGSNPFIVLIGEDGTANCQAYDPDVMAQNQDDKKCFIAFSDSSNLADYPGWPARNIIASLRLRNPACTKLNLLCLRESMESSIVFFGECEPLAEDVLSKPVKTLGWVDTKIKMVDMGASMDPNQLAASSSKLNLGLMKWRMMPNLKLDELADCKALLLGSGTLGCHIARNLLMWGVTNMTFVDRGTVSYSNPVRQTLFELSDVLAEGEARVKSIAAAKAIKRILPSANAEGVRLTIRMPGHRIDDVAKDEAIKEITDLEELIKAHDVVFLLTDSRESRWLPSVLAAVHSKPLINVALGFDTYVVMRHGLAEAGEDRVGCYFCNDVVAPVDSLTARTLDQQCTVTRPGVSALASALAVELLSSLYNHPKGFLAPAYDGSDDAPEASTMEGELGIVPHQVRGSVRLYDTMTMRGQAYAKCTACSDKIVNTYKEEGVEFLVKCLNEPDYMEEITGLKAEREAAAEKHGNWDEDEMS